MEKFNIQEAYNNLVKEENNSLTKENIISILKDMAETAQWGSDGEYYSYLAVGEEDFDLVAEKILALNNPNL